MELSRVPPRIRQMVRGRPEVIMLRVGGSCRLRVEVVGIDKVDVLRADMERGRYDLPWRSNEIKLGERVVALLLRLVVGKAQGSALDLIEKILQSRVDV